MLAALPTIESIEKPIFGFDGTDKIGIGAKGIILICKIQVREQKYRLISSNITRIKKCTE